METSTQECYYWGHCVLRKKPNSFAYKDFKVTFNKEPAGFLVHSTLEHFNSEVLKDQMDPERNTSRHSSQKEKPELPCRLGSGIRRWPSSPLPPAFRPQIQEIPAVPEVLSHTASLLPPSRVASFLWPLDLQLAPGRWMECLCQGKMGGGEGEGSEGLSVAEVLLQHQAGCCCDFISYAVHKGPTREIHLFLFQK